MHSLLCESFDKRCQRLRLAPVLHQEHGALLGEVRVLGHHALGEILVVWRLTDGTILYREPRKSALFAGACRRRSACARGDSLHQAQQPEAEFQSNGESREAMLQGQCLAFGDEFFVKVTPALMGIDSQFGFVSIHVREKCKASGTALQHLFWIGYATAYQLA